MRNAQAIFAHEDRTGYEQAKYSPMVRAGDILFVSGIIGEEDGRVPADPEAEFRAAFGELDQRLRAAGGTLADVVALDTFHVSADLANEVGLFMAVKAEYLVGPDYPAWTAIGVASLGLPGARVEIRATAALPPARDRR